jgi:hypothetical protein
MTISMLPITGVPLPLISYSGSFVLMIMFGLGIVNSVWVHPQESGGARHCCARDGDCVVTGRRRSSGDASGQSGGERPTDPVTDPIASERRFRFFLEPQVTFGTLAAKYDQPHGR